MSSLGFVRPAAACVTMGAALYVTRGVLDQAEAGGAVVRIALLPPWQAFAGFVCLAGLVLLGLAHLNAPRGTTAGRRPRLGDLTRPLLAVGVLLVPFVPVVSDRLPVLQALAGPLRGVVWLVVAAMLVWVSWQARLITLGWLARRSVNQLAVGIGLATAVVSGASAARLTNTALFPSGDEPHYLVIAQSLWRDGDLKIENNHERGDYREYFHRDLGPDYLTRGVDQEIYPIHPVGLPVLLAPVYAAGGYRGVVGLLIAMAAVAAAAAWRWMVTALNAPGAATFAWAGVALSVPYLFNTFTIYPEIAAALAVMVALPLAQERGPSPSCWRWLAIGLAAGVLPWLSTKYAPMSGALMAVALLRVERGPAAPWRTPAVGWLVLPYAASLAAWSAYFFVFWGSPLPTAPYGSMTQTSPANLVFGAPGLLFDQEYGLLAYAPVYVLAATGLVALWHGGSTLRRQAIEAAAVFASLIGTVGAHRLWWGGTSAPARPLASGLLLLALPMAAAFRAAPAGSARRAGQHVLLWVSVGVAITMTIAQNGLLVANARDGTSALLEWWSPRWEAWTLAPSFVFQPTPVAMLHTAVWLATAAAAAWLLGRLRNLQPGAAALAALGTFGAALMAVVLVMPWMPADPPQPRAALGARSRLAALNAFDRRALPSAVVFDPLRKIAAGDVLPLLRLGVVPGIRTAPPPLRVIHNGRFSLPAGHYRFDVTFGDRVPEGEVAIALQVGRVGQPLDTWTIEPRPRATWTADVWLPVAAGFVGLRGSVELEQSIAAIEVTPTAVVDAGDRPRVPEVLSAARAGAATVFAHDERIYQQAPGVWTVGGRRTRLTIAATPARTTPLVLRVHCGAQANAATLGAHGWQQRVTLMPGEPQDVTLPAALGNVVTLTIDTDTGFFPWKLDPDSRDRRFLGIWIEGVAEP